MGIDPKMGGAKFDSGKPDWALFPLKALEGVVRVMEFGAKKYARGNWKKVAPHRYFSALMRHLADYINGQEFDSETGFHHLWHAGCDMVFLLWRLQAHPFTAQDIADALESETQATGTSVEDVRDVNPGTTHVHANIAQTISDARDPKADFGKPWLEMQERYGNQMRERVAVVIQSTFAEDLLREINEADPPEEPGPDSPDYPHTRPEGRRE